MSAARSLKTTRGLIAVRPAIGRSHRIATFGAAPIFNRGRFSRFS